MSTIIGLCKSRFYHKNLRHSRVIPSFYDADPICTRPFIVSILRKQNAKAMADLGTQQKKEYAKMLYLKGGLSQAEIAERSGLSRQTIGAAIKKEKWDILKAEIAMTDEEMIQQIRQQINEVKQEIDTRKPGERKYTPADLDGLRKLYKTMKELKGEATVADMVSFGEKFIAYVRPIDLAFAKRFTALYDAFIKDNLK